MRLKSSRVTAANERAINVLARPGKSSISTWPSARTAIRTRASTSRLPTIARSTSPMIRSDRAATCSSVNACTELLQLLHRRAHTVGIDASCTPCHFEIDRRQQRPYPLSQNGSRRLRVRFDVDRPIRRQPLRGDRAQDRAQLELETRGIPASTSDKAVDGAYPLRQLVEVGLVFDAVVGWSPEHGIAGGYDANRDGDADGADEEQVPAEHERS